MTDLSRSARVARMVATVGGLGDRLPAPGTFAGSLPATIAWWGAALASPEGGPGWAAAAVAAVLAALGGGWAASVESARRGHSDPGPVVIDEVAGQWLCFAVASSLAGSVAVASLAAAGFGFVTFRVFDVLKPWPVNRLERLPGAWGIMADDLVAGALAGVVVGFVLGVV